MLSVSRVTVSKGLEYYKRDNYYTKDGAISNSDWYGKGAEEAGLRGKIKEKPFDKLLFGSLPDGTSIRMKKATSDGLKERAGTDLTFSAPKSISLKAFLGEDLRLIQAHKEAVRAALDMVQSRYVATRVGGQADRRLEYTENMIIAQFHHDTSRAMDPQLHTHNILFNGTRAKEGWRSVYDDIFRNRSKDIGVIYQNELARRVLDLGYEITRSYNGTFELKGYSREEILHFSKRHLEIEEQGAVSKKQERLAVLKTREAKEYELDRLLWERHRRDGEKIGLSHPIANPERALRLEPKSPSDFVELSISHLSRKNVAFSKEEIETLALSFSLGLYSSEEIHQATQAKIGSRLIRAQKKAIDPSIETLEHELGRFKTEGYQDAIYSKLAELKNASLRPVYDELSILALRERDNGSLEPIRASSEGILSSRHLLHLAKVDKESLSRFGMVSRLQAEYESAKIRGISGNGISLKEFSYSINALKSHDNYYEFLKKDYPSQSGEIWIIDKVEKIRSSYLRQILEKAEREKARIVFLGGDERIKALAGFKPFGKLDTKSMEDIVKTERSNFDLRLTQEEFTTRTAQETERKILEFVESGKGKFQPVVTEDSAKDFVYQKAEKFSSKSGFSLTEGQRQALEVTLSTEDQFHRWRGVAGAGKTTSMDILREQFEFKGYLVRGFAPTGDAALNLSREARIKDFGTVASLLTSKSREDRARGRELWIIDEAGMLSNEDKLRLAEKAHTENARVLLVGDERQNSSIGAGNPFYLSKRSDINTALLEQTLRPKSQYMKEVFNDATKLNAREALETIDRHGKLIEVKSLDERLEAVAKDYVGSGPDSLVICKTNKEKGAVTQKIRSMLIEGEGLGKEKISFIGLSPVDKTEDQLKFSFHYEVGQVLVPFENRGRLTKGQRYIVSEIRENSLVVTSDLGKTITVKPDALKVQLFNQNEMEIRTGDKLCWTKIHNDDYGEKRNTGAIVTVLEVDESRGSILVDAGSSRRYHLSGDRMQYFSFGYVSTVDSVQGKTTSKAIVLADSLYDKESINVAATRAKEDLVVYTEDKSSLYPQIDHHGRNLTSHEVIEAFDHKRSTGNLKNKAEIEREVDDFGIEI